MKEFDRKAFLWIYDKLNNTGSVDRNDIIEECKLSEKSVSRYIKSINDYFSERHIDKKIVFNGIKKVYEIKGHKGTILNERDVLSISKVLLESRGFCKEEMTYILDKLLYNCVSYDKKIVNSIIGNENYNYISVKHNEKLIDKLWDLSLAIKNQFVLEIEYCKIKKGGKVEEVPCKKYIKPVAILFSEYYFYLAAYKEEKNYEYPTIYRVDRIKNYKSAERKFSIEDSSRFKDGEFKKLIQFMQTGKLERVRFKFKGPSVEAVLDRLPNAKIIDEKQGEFTIETKMFGQGIKMWLLSQGDSIEVLSPKDFREEMKNTIERMKEMYKTC
ncbi:helix-turn-helix transcriptional regulator [Haloimpatiens sp. FM7315]|uniref:helix-turn-helix transcriptional regulator n=1 Tax=Haloimpatiens sp. FM7315 TaxID=3298609 RepID=UPI0035A3B140